MTARTGGVRLVLYGQIARLRAVAVCLCMTLGLAAVLGPASADYLPMDGAEVANNIAEIRVEDDGVRIQLEIYVGDARTFEALLPDAWFSTDTSERPDEAERLAEFAETGVTVRREDGSALPLRIAVIEPRMRFDRTTALTGQRDPLTGREFPKPPDDPRVIYAELVYGFEGTRPAVIEISPPMDEAGFPRATIGMAVFDRDVPVTNFRYLSAPARLTMDWNDPWYSRFDNPNLRRHHRSGVTTYLYVEPRELRHETLIRVRDIDPWIGLDLTPGQRLSAEEQDRIKEQGAQFLAGRNPLAIDGMAATPASYRAELLTLDTSGLQIVEDKVALSADAAFLGVILSFPHRDLPETATVQWDMFNERITNVPATASDPAGPFLSGATPDAPEIVWNNHLLTYEAPVVAPVPVGASGRVGVPILSVLAGIIAVAAVVAAIRRRGMLRYVGAGLAAAGIAGAVALVNVANVNVRNPFEGVPEPDEAVLAFDGLLGSINIAQLEVGPEARQGALEPLVTRAAMDQVAPELERALAVRVPGGGLARVNSVGGLVIEDMAALPQGFGFSGLAAWTADASAGHWGHGHRRIVEYRALIEVVEEAGHWKLDGITVLEARLPDA